MHVPVDGYYVRIMKRDSFERSAYWLNTVIAENIATTTNNAEIKDFFSSWYVSLLPHLTYL